ncbi:MAG: hypothetical protein K6U80_09645 [Firmicutes bacterium]|nr:hypothetical protein [Bacillota bacterium]
MKKFLLVVILLGLYLSFPALARAETGFQLEKASLDAAWSETYSAWMTVYQLNAGGNWEWLNLGLTGRFDVPDTGEAGSALKLAFDFPKLEDRLGFEVQFSWDTRYQLLTTGVRYKRDFGKYWQAALDYEKREKEELTSQTWIYRNQREQASVSLEFEYEPWKYQIKYLGQINDYPEISDYSSAKTELHQEIFRRFGEDLSLALYYQETADDYPGNFKRNYWQIKWGLKGDWKAGERFQWNWDYYRLSREEYTLTGKRQSIKLELESVIDKKKKNKLLTQFSSSDYSSEFDKEYQALIPEDDPRVDLPPVEPTRKLAIRYIHKFIYCSLGVGCYYSEAYDCSEGITIYRNGLFSFCEWEYQQTKLALKVSPTGDFQHHKPYYEIKISHEF